MAEEQIRNTLIPDTPEKETFAAAEQSQPTNKPTRRGKGGANGTNDATLKRARTRKKSLDSAASPAESAATDTAAAPARKQATSRKSIPAKRRKTAQLLKKEDASPESSQGGTTSAASPALPPIPVHADTETTAVDSTPFEPDLDPTPVKARETPPRSLATIEAELDALLSELVPEESLSELEDTMARKAAEQAIPPASSGNTLPEIPETPMLPTLERAKVPDTPLPPPIVAPPKARPRLRRRPLKRVAMLLALLVCLASSLLLWQNVNETHLYLYSINPGNG